jgi:SAM-dependent methyltransferase
MARPNESEHRRWNADHWSTAWPKRERLTDEVTGCLLDASSLRPGERVLDIGYGGGKTSLAAAEAVGLEGAVVGVDISEPLNRLASRRAAEGGVANVSFHVADMQTDRLEGGPFDAAISQFGVMFFDEPVTAFSNVRSHLRQAGRMAFACWQGLEQNPWFFAPAVAEFVPPPPDVAPGKSATGPFALADADHTRAVLKAAGFESVERRTYEIEVEVPGDSVVDEDQLIFMGVPEERLGAALIAVDEYMRRFEIDSVLSRFPLAFQIFTAVNPGT